MFRFNVESTEPFLKLYGIKLASPDMLGSNWIRNCFVAVNVQSWSVMTNFWIRVVPKSGLAEL